MPRVIQNQSRWATRSGSLTLRPTSVNSDAASSTSPVSGGSPCASVATYRIHGGRTGALFVQRARGSAERRAREMVLEDERSVVALTKTRERGALRRRPNLGRRSFRVRRAAPFA